jgi:hypothetical protein
MVKKSIFYVMYLSVLVFSCGSIDDYDKGISEYLADKENVYEDICRQAGLEVWNYYSDTTQSSMDRYKHSFYSFFKDDTFRRNIKTWNRDIRKVKNDILRRRLELWNNILTCARVDFDPETIKLQNRLEKQISDYSPGENQEYEIEKNVKRLINLRNERAKALEYGNYANMVLHNTGIDTTWFKQLIDIVDSRTLPAYNQLLDEIRIAAHIDTIKYNNIRPYIIQAIELNDVPNIEVDLKEDVIKATLGNIGLDITNQPMQIEIVDLPPGIGGFGNCIDIPNDFRVVVMRELSFRYIMHEIGHGLHWTSVTTTTPVLKGYEWCKGNLADCYSEAMAETIAKFVESSTFLRSNGYTKHQIDSLTSVRLKVAPVWLRLQLIRSLFEVELYKNPDRSPASIKAQLYRKYLNVDMDFTHRANLVRLSFVSYPVYEQNYLIADIISWQIHDYLTTKYGHNYSSNKAVGEELIEMFWKDGELRPWQERLLYSTGSNLAVDRYLKSLKM